MNFLTIIQRKQVSILVSALLSLFACLAQAQEQESYEVVGIAANDVLNVRAGAGASYPIVGRLRNRDRDIQIMGPVVMNGRDDWVPIKFPTGEGWTRPKFLVKTRPVILPATQVPSENTGTKSRVKVAEDGGGPDVPSTKLGESVVNPTDGFTYQMSPQPTRQVQKALLGEWKLEGSDLDAFSSAIFTQADDLHYKVQLVGMDGKWPQTARAWHADNRGYSFLTIEVLPAIAGEMPVYLHFHYSMQDGDLKLVPLSQPNVRSFQNWLEERGWRPLDDNRHPWPGTAQCPEQFRAIVLRMLDADSPGSSHPIGFLYKKQGGDASNAETVQHFLESLKDANDEYFTMTAYQMHMTEEPTMRRLRRLLEIEQSPRANQLPEKMRGAITEAVNYNMRAMSLYIASRVQGAQTRKEYERLLPDWIKGSLGNSQARERVEMGFIQEVLRGGMIQSAWDSFRRDRHQQYTHGENWAAAIESAPYSSEIAAFQRNPSETDPGFQFFMSGYQGDEFIFPNHSRTGRDQQRLPYPAPKQCEQIGSVDDGPIKIHFGPWRDLTCAGVLFSAPAKSRVIVQLTCTSGHAGIHRSVDYEGWSNGANTWAAAGMVDPLYQGTSIIESAPDRQRIYLGISHSVFDPWGASDAAEGYVTIYMEGQDPGSPTKECEILAGGTILAR